MSSSARRSILQTALLAAGLVVAGGVADAQLSGANRDDFVKSSIASCMSVLHDKHPENPATANRTYCTCMAQKEADATTPDDLAYIAKNNTPPAGYTDKITPFAAACNAAAGLH